MIKYKSNGQKYYRGNSGRTYLTKADHDYFEAMEAELLAMGEKIAECKVGDKVVLTDKGINMIRPKSRNEARKLLGVFTVEKVHWFGNCAVTGIALLGYDIVEEPLRSYQVSNGDIRKYED